MEKKDLLYNYNEIQKDMIKSILFQQNSIPAVSEIISSADFDNDKYQAIYKSCLEMYSLKEKITQATLYNHLKKERNIDLTIDDAILFTSPPLDPPISLANILKTKSVINSAIKMSNNSIKELNDGNTPLETLGKLQTESAELSYRLNSDGEKTLKDEIFELKEEILKDKGEEVYVIPSPYETLNKYINKGFMPEQLITIGARTGVGKALDIRTPILTKDGWKTMKDIKVGDIVYGKDGKETRVIFATEIQYNRECYMLNFSNRTSLIADAEHLWEASNYLERRENTCSIYSTKEMFETQRVNKDKRVNYSISKTNPLIFTHNDKDIDLPIDPYILGYWLGDGLTRSLKICGDNKDLDNLTQEMDRAGYYYRIKTEDNLFELKFSLFENVSEVYRLEYGKDSLLNRFKNLGLIMNKHIPDIYKKSSTKQRTEILKGLLDSDGCVSKAGRQEFGVTRKALFEDALEIANSLGITPFVNKVKKIKGATEETSNAYSFSFKSDKAYFKLKRKRDRVLSNNNQRLGKIYINSIEKTTSVPVKCIQVDNEDHIYLAGKSLIPTHNTVVATQTAATACALGKSVLFFSLEMSSEQLIKRIAACHGNIMLSLLRPRDDRDNDTKNKISNVMDEISKWKLKIIDSPDVTMEKIRSIAQQTAQSEDGLDMIIIDYLQLISTKGNYNRNRQETVAEISRGCKMMAKELGVPVMVLVQLNREMKGEDPDRLPGKEDIRESAAIAADSDIVLIIHRKSKDDSTDPKALFILDKNREGASDKKFLMRCVLEKNIFQDLKKEANSLNEDEFFGPIPNDKNNDEIPNENVEPPTDFANVQDVKNWGLDNEEDTNLSDSLDDYDIFGGM